MDVWMDAISGPGGSFAEVSSVQLVSALHSIDDGGGWYVHWRIGTNK